MKFHGQRFVEVNFAKYPAYVYVFSVEHCVIVQRKKAIGVLVD